MGDREHESNSITMKYALKNTNGFEEVSRKKKKGHNDLPVIPSLVKIRDKRNYVCVLWF